MKRLSIALLSLLLALPAFAASTDGDSDETVGISARYVLMAPNGRAISNEDLAGQFQLITFGYTFCPDICPTTLAEMATILEKVGKNASRLQPLFITVDPERDTLEVLRKYTEFFHPRIMGLTGSPPLIRGVAKNFNVRYEKVRMPGKPADQYAVDHSAGMYLLGPEGQFLRKFAYATPTDEIVTYINEMMAKADAMPKKEKPRPVPGGL